MLQLLALGLSLVLPAQPAAVCVAQAPVESPAWVPCRFDWPLPTSVWITQETEKRGKTSTMRYRLTLSRGAEEGELKARLSDHEFLKVGGRDVTTPELRKALAPALAMAAATPDTVVDAEGHYLRIESFDALMERMVATGGLSAAEQEQTLAAMKTPAMQATLQEACGQIWKTWVGAWIDFPVGPGEEATADDELPFAGTVLPAKMTARNHGPSDGKPGHFDLSITTLMEGEAATKAFAAGMAALVQQSGKPFDTADLLEFRSNTEVTVVTDRATLKPLRASYLKTTRLAMKGEGVKEEVERNEYTFDWAKAEKVEPK